MEPTLILVLILQMYERQLDGQIKIKFMDIFALQRLTMRVNSGHVQ